MFKWLMSPTKLPAAPSWRFVFLFAAVWNALIERCTWATLACLGITVMITVLNIKE